MLYENKSNVLLKRTHSRAVSFVLVIACLLMCFFVCVCWFLAQVLLSCEDVLWGFFGDPGSLRTVLRYLNPGG